MGFVDIFRKLWSWLSNPEAAPEPEAEAYEFPICHGSDIAYHRVEGSDTTYHALRDHP